MSELLGSIPEHWVMCSRARRFSIASAGTSEDSDKVAFDVQRVVERADGVAVEGEW
jgi:hypothetical protein